MAITWKQLAYAEDTVGRSITINTTSPLTGGGSLDQSRTISIENSLDQGYFIYGGGGGVAAWQALSSLWGNGLEANLTTGLQGHILLPIPSGLVVDASGLYLGIPLSITATSANALSTSQHSHAADSTLARSAITITGGNGMAAGTGGDLTANRTITLGTPGDSTSTSTSAVTTNGHTHAIDSTIARSAITITGGNGMAAGTGGNLTANRTIILGTPSACTVSSTSAVTTNSHTHAITASSSTGAAAALLKTDVSGYLQIVGFGAGAAPTGAGDIVANADVRAGGGIYVGGIATNPATGTITATSTIQSNTGFSMNGNAGLIYVPLIPAANLTDNQGTPQLWSAYAAPIGTYVFHMADAANLGATIGAIVKAVQVMFFGTWAAASNASTMTLRERGGSVAQAQVRSYVAAYSIIGQAIINCDTTNHDIEVVIAGANLTSGNVRVVGYFI